MLAYKVLVILNMFIKARKGFPVGSVVKNPPASKGATGDAGLIPGLGRFLEEEMATRSGILAWRIPWTEELGGLQFIGF